MMTGIMQSAAVVRRLPSGISPQLVENFAGILNILGKEVFRDIVRSMGLGNHVAGAFGIIHVAVFFF
jgi:hypothetical protein